MTHLKVGDKAPAIDGIDQEGKRITLEEYKGKKVVLYFYPRDNTPTCTTESCNLRDNYSDLQKLGYDVIGVSDDSAKKHTNFINKYELPFRLLADTEQEALKAYGVWGPKKFMGREFIGTHRTTFVIDEKGMIEQIIGKVKAKEHTQQILENAPA